MTNIGIPQRQRIRLVTPFGVVEGQLGSETMVRTLDELNVVARNFLMLHAPVVIRTDWGFSGDRLVIHKSAILFAIELSEPQTRPNANFGANHYGRVPVRLKVGDYVVTGSLHILSGGDPMKQLNQSVRTFIAITGATVRGPDLEFTAPFIAVNVAHILVAEGSPAPLPEVAPVSEDEESQAWEEPTT